MSNKKILANEWNEEAERLNALMQRRNEEELKAVAEMSKRPLSSEQVKAQTARRHGMTLEEYENWRKAQLSRF